MPHYCNFCQVEHSAASCYHPGRQENERLREAIMRACSPGKGIAIKAILLGVLRTIDRKVFLAHEEAINQDRERTRNRRPAADREKS